MANPEQPTKSRGAFKSLTFKVGFLASLIMIVVLAVFTVVFVVSERQKTEAGILENGETFANFSSTAIYDLYLQFYTHPQPEDFNNFKNRVTTTLNYNGDIKNVSLLSLNGRVLFDSKEFVDGKYSGPPRVIEDKKTIETLQSNAVSVRELDSRSERTTEIMVPLLDAAGSHFLVMRYELTYGSLEQQMLDVYQRIAIVALILMVFVVVVAAALSLRLTRPIVLLTRISEQIKGGNFDVRAPGSGNDELGRLGLALNQMAEQLKGYYKDLETKVRDRTKALEETQTKLQTNVKRNDALLASIGDGVLATDDTGAVVLINKVAEDLLHVRQAEVLGQPFRYIWNIIDSKGNPVHGGQDPIAIALSGGNMIRSSEYSYFGKDRNGRIINFPISLNVAPVVSNNQVIGAISVFRDITHEKEVDRMKTEFISLASHQLRTPLSAIKWFGEMLLAGDAGKLNPEQTDFAKNIFNSTERMIELVNGLLNISRLESGRIIIAPKPTNLNLLITNIVKDLQPKINQKQQTLVVSAHQDIGAINIDPQLVGQVYLNLLSNAIKYTPKGGEISIIISRKGEEVISQISDNGYGIPDAQQSKVFQKFFRAENVAKIETDGTGLGLYLAKAIVEAAGGRIWFQSKTGQGTSFWFSLPYNGMKPKEGDVNLMEMDSLHMV